MNNVPSAASAICPQPGAWLIPGEVSLSSTGIVVTPPEP
jgi:hypothetical protein